MQRSKIRSSTTLTIAAIAMFISAGALALLDNHASGRAVAAGFVGAGLAKAGLAAYVRDLVAALSRIGIPASQSTAGRDVTEARAQGYAEGYVDGIARRVDSTPS